MTPNEKPLNSYEFKGFRGSERTSKKSIFNSKTHFYSIRCKLVVKF